MPVQKLQPSFNLEQDRIEMLKQLIPEAVSDGKINWDVLKEALGEHICQLILIEFGALSVKVKVAKPGIMAGLKSLGVIVYRTK